MYNKVSFVMLVYLLIIYLYRGANHCTQSDAAFIIPESIPLDPEMTSSDIEKYLCHSLNIEICNTFLKRHLLKGIKYTIQQLMHTIRFTH